MGFGYRITKNAMFIKMYETFDGFFDIELIKYLDFYELRALKISSKKMNNFLAKKIDAEIVNRLQKFSVLNRFSKDKILNTFAPIASVFNLKKNCQLCSNELDQKNCLYMKHYGICILFLDIYSRLFEMKIQSTCLECLFFYIIQ
jgi:hypothetical protein